MILHASKQFTFIYFKMFMIGQDNFAQSRSQKLDSLGVEESPASILSADGDVAMMVRLMDEIIDRGRIQPLAKIINYFEQVGFNWNDVYLATITHGQDYTGTFGGADGQNFFFRDDENRVLVGKLQDLKQPVKSGERISFTAS